MKWNLLNVFTLLFMPVFFVSILGTNLSDEATSNYRKIDELERQMDEILQRTKQIEGKISAVSERLD